jgi:hypothetical protein
MAARQQDNCPKSTKEEEEEEEIEGGETIGEPQRKSHKE